MVLNNYLRFFSENRFEKGAYKKFVFLFFLINMLFVAFTLNHPIGDFGNYYYGSKFFLSGLNPVVIYKDLHFFNAAIRNFESGPFLENYTPVPPFSLLFYIPFLALKCSGAKILFNILGALILSLSFYRLIRYLQIFNYWFYFLPTLMFFQALYSNYHQGQSYLFITALLLEFFMAWQQQKGKRQGLILALLFSLKIFVAFPILLLLLKKEWSAVRWTIFFSSLIQSLTFVCVGADTFFYYYGQVLPRLSMNEITDPFSYYNQSFHVFLLNAFGNSTVPYTLPGQGAATITFILEWAFYTLLFGLLWAAIRKLKTNLLFFMLLLVMELATKYATVYGLLVLFPFIFVSAQLSPRTFGLFALLFIVAGNLPIHRLIDLPPGLQYLRLWLLLALFIMLIMRCELKPDWRIVLLCLPFFMLPSLVFYKYVSRNETVVYPSKGVLYDFETGPGGLYLHSCLGNRDTLEKMEFAVSQIDSTGLSVDGSHIKLYGRTVYTSRGQIKRPILINSNELLFMTDENRGMGMYVLTLLRLKNNLKGS